MSVQNESLEMKAVERKPEAPELEYKAASQDSLAMFFAAIGGAVLGMLATLLVLAVINGGTLNFIHPERLAVLEDSMTRVNENVGAVSQNVDTVSAQVKEIRTGLADAAVRVDQARADLQTQGGDVAQVQAAVTGLQQTGEKFDRFVLALQSALGSMDQPAATTAAAATVATAATTTAAASAPSAAALPAPKVATDAQVKAGDVAVLVFVDTNGNGVMDADEAILVGPQIAVQDAQGQTIDTYASTDAGVLVAGLDPAAYLIIVEDTAGHTLQSADQAQVTIAKDAKEGQVVYFPAAK